MALARTALGSVSLKGLEETAQRGVCWREVERSDDRPLTCVRSPRKFYGVNFAISVHYSCTDDGLGSHTCYNLMKIDTFHDVADLRISQTRVHFHVKVKPLVSSTWIKSHSVKCLDLRRNLKQYIYSSH